MYTRRLRSNHSNPDHLSRKLRRRRLFERLESRQLLAGDTITWEDFSDASDLNLIGHAATTADRLRITPAQSGRKGAAWHHDKQFVSIAFESQFRFQITDPDSGGGGDGFAFVIQNTSDSILGGGGGHMGYHQIPNSLAIEFDTSQNADDPNDNHVSVHTRGLLRNHSNHSYSLGSFTPSGFKLDEGDIHTVKIAYSPGSLSVFLDDLTNPMLTVPVDLNELLDLDFGRAYVGFAGATGGGWENHDILDWNFGHPSDITAVIGITDWGQIEGDSGQTNLEFSIKRLGDSSDTITVDWSTSPGTATPGTDYTSSSGQVTLASGETEALVSVPVAGDVDEEDHETFGVNIQLATGSAVVVDADATGTILNDEASISISNSAAIENSDQFRFIDTFLKLEPTGINAARGIQVGPDGNLYISTNVPAAVLRFDTATGQFIDQFASSPSGQHAVFRDLQIGPDGNFYVSDTHDDRILQYDGTTGEFIQVFVPNNLGGLDAPQTILFGADNHMYVVSAASDEVLRFQGPLETQPGALIDAFVTAGSGGLDNPSSLLLGPDGDFYVASSNTDSVLRFDGLTGNYRDTFVSSGSGGLDRILASSMIFGPDRTGDGEQDLYVSSGVTDSVLVFNGVTGSYEHAIVPTGLGGVDLPAGLMI